MRKSVFFLGAVAGTCLTLLVSGPRGELLIAAAKAAASADTYSQLNLLGDVFERVRTDYVEKPDELQAGRGSDQRHGHLPRSAFAVHE